MSTVAKIGEDRSRGMRLSDPAPCKESPHLYYCLQCHHAITLEDKDTIQCERCHYSVFYKKNIQQSHMLLTD